MKLLSLQKTLSTALLLVLFCTTSALAATVTVTASGDTSYSVQGSGMTGVAGIELNINYDATSLSSPNVKPILGGMFAANTSRPGSIKIAIVSTTAFSGSDSVGIVNITFAGRTGTGGITSASVSMIDTKGAKIAASITVSGTSSSGIPGLSSTPGVPFSQQTVTTTENPTSLTISDALKVLQAVVGLIQLTESEKIQYDLAPLVDGFPLGDGKIDLGDTLVILRRILGLFDW